MAATPIMVGNGPPVCDSDGVIGLLMGSSPFIPDPF